MSKKTVQLVENFKSRAILETKPRYDITINGVVCGELYFNMKGYVGYLPQASGIVLDCGEGGITRFKRELTRINRGFAEAGELAYYELRLANKWDSARQVSEPCNPIQVVCPPFRLASSEAEIKNIVATGEFKEYVAGKAVEAGRMTLDEIKLVQGVMKMEEADYWKKRLVQH